MGAESKLEKRITKDMERNGWLVNKNMLNSLPGWPDRTAVKEGRTVYLELKAPGKTLEPLQEYRHKQIKEHGGEVYCVDTWEEYLNLKL
jgi:hypothetical protein